MAAPAAASTGDGVPGAISAAIVAELDALAAPPRRLAEAAAVAGDPFELDVAIAAAGMGDAEALEALDALIGHDLVRSAEVPRRFRFRHPLVRRAVYESCPPGSATCRTRAQRRRARGTRRPGRGTRTPRRACRTLWRPGGGRSAA